MRRFVFVCLVLTVACGRETPTPPPPATEIPTTPITTSTPAPTTTTVPTIDKGSYDEALLWMRSAPKFHFVLDDHGIHAEGDMARKTLGAEQVQFRANGHEWLAESTVKGVTWKQRSGSAWKETAAPEFGSRIYQRVTLAFDPQKKEGVPMLVSRDNGANLYRFTDANTNEVHELWVNQKDAHVERLKIGDQVELTIAVAP